MAQTSQFFHLYHRLENVHDSNAAAGFIINCFKKARHKLEGVTLESRMDSAFFSKKILRGLGSQHIKFSASVAFERFPELKDRIEQRKRWRTIDREWSYFKTKWKPKSWDTIYRFILVRKKARKQRESPLQLHLFEPRDFNCDYKAIVTNKTESTKAVVQLHNGRGSQEAIFAHAKGDCGLYVIATRRPAGNQI